MTTTLQVEADAQTVVYSPPDSADRKAIELLLTEAYRPFPEWSGACSQFSEPARKARLDFNIERQMGIVAKVEDQLVGIAGWRFRRGHPAIPTPNCVELVVLFVTADFRRQGIGEALCRSYLDRCTERQFGSPSFNLPTDVAVEGLMKKIGYSESSRIFGASGD